MVTGIIYKYTAPNGKVYIGQTTNELYRRRMWFGTGRYTGGKSKIDRARRKYGAVNFTYEILFKRKYTSVEIATQELNRLESYYIGLYDSYRKGYNSTLGGDSSRGYVPTEETRRKQSVATKGRKKSADFGIKVSTALRGKSKSQAHRRHLSESKRNSGNKIAQYTLEGGLIRVWDNIDVVSTMLGVCRESIAGCCRGKSKSAHGYLWRYAKGVPSHTIPPKGRRCDTRAVLQLSLDGHLLKEFISVEDAANSVGVASTNISACCRGKTQTIKGYKWIYKDGNL